MKAWPGSTRSTLFATPHVLLDRRDDGSVLFRSQDPLREHPTTVLHSFRRWAQAEPDRVLAAERTSTGDGWRGLTYGEAERADLAALYKAEPRMLATEREDRVLTDAGLRRLSNVR